MKGRPPSCPFAVQDLFIEEIYPCFVSDYRRGTSLPLRGSGPAAAGKIETVQR